MPCHCFPETKNFQSLQPLETLVCTLNVLEGVSRNKITDKITILWDQKGLQLLDFQIARILQTSHKVKMHTSFGKLGPSQTNQGWSEEHYDMCIQLAGQPANHTPEKVSSNVSQEVETLFASIIESQQDLGLKCSAWEDFGSD